VMLFFFKGKNRWVRVRYMDPWRPAVFNNQRMSSRTHPELLVLFWLDFMKPRLVFPPILVNKLSFILCFLFPQRLHSCYIYFSLLLPIITLEHCALNAEFFIISYPDLIKFPYFVDTTEREDRGGESRGDRGWNRRWHYG
jgi:hypothetical protein